MSTFFIVLGICLATPFACFLTAILFYWIAYVIFVDLPSWMGSIIHKFLRLSREEREAFIGNAMCIMFLFGIGSICIGLLINSIERGNSMQKNIAPISSMVEND